MAAIYNIKEYASKKLYSSTIPQETSEDYSSHLSMLIESHSAMTEMYNILKEKAEAEHQKLVKQNEQLKSENEALKLKLIHFESCLKKCVPTHIIWFLIVNAIVITLSATLTLLFYYQQIYIIDIYYLLCVLIISTTLFCTALRALADWRVMLNEKKQFSN